MKNFVKDSIENALKKLNIEKTVILTDSKSYGDYSSNIALSLQKDMSLNAMEIANLIVSNIDKEKFFIKKIEIIKPGFINFFLDDKFYFHLLENFSKGNFLIDIPERHSYNLEYVSANPTGFLHIGHARGAAIGDTLANILEFGNQKVIREYYINDAGNQVKTLAFALFVRYNELLKSNKYSLPEDSYHGEDIKFFASILIAEIGDLYLNVEYDEKIEAVFVKKGVEIALKKIKSDLERMNVKFDVWSSEKAIYHLIPEALSKLKDLYKKDNATWLKTSKYGDDKDRVLIKSDGSYTYFTPDLAYHFFKKTRDKGVDYLIDFFGADHIGYVKRMQIALKQFGFSDNTLNVMILELVKLIKNGQEFKMSKRKGTTVTLEDLLDIIGVDAARFFLIDRANTSKIELDIDLISKKDMNNGVFIIQYAHARAFSIIDKYILKTKTDVIISNSDKIFENKFETKLINSIKEFPALIEKIVKNFKIHLLPQYLITLAKDFNSFYSNSKILGSSNEAKLILLVKATKTILEKGLKLMGIEAPERM